MTLFPVYPLLNISLINGSGCVLTDDQGKRYLDFYGGHGVISVGHSHPHYVQRLSDQLQRIGFYSNSVKIGMQEELAEKLGQISGYENYSLFLCNSGAEANENALKLASFQNGRKNIIAFSGAFHGRTSLAVEATDGASYSAPVNRNGNVQFLPFNDSEALEKAMDDQVCAVIIEGIQGVGGVQVPDRSFLGLVQSLCEKHGAFFICDEVQSGYGRTGKFFAHQHAGVRPDIITVAKGMGNGFPIGGVLISGKFKARMGMLGTTFGGNHLACTAALAVLEIMEKEKLMENASLAGSRLIAGLAGIPGTGNIRGKGLMIGFDPEGDAGALRHELTENGVLTGSSGKNTVRLLPPLNVSGNETGIFLTKLKQLILSKTMA